MTTTHARQPLRMFGRQAVRLCACGDPWPCKVATGEQRWKELKDYLTANAEAMAAEADEQENSWPSLELAPVLRARSEIFALVRQYMGEMDATAGTPPAGEQETTP